MTIYLAVGLALLPMQVSAQGSAPAAAVAAAKSYGFTDVEIEKILHGDILAKDLKEGSDYELAGVVAVLFPKPLAEFSEIALEGKLLTLDPAIRSLNVWKLDESADKAIADLRVDAAHQAMLKGRYEAYRKNGLKGVLAYARGAKNAASPGELHTV